MAVAMCATSTRTPKSMSVVRFVEMNRSRGTAPKRSPGARFSVGLAIVACRTTAFQNAGLCKKLGAMDDLKAGVARGVKMSAGAARFL